MDAYVCRHARASAAGRTPGRPMCLRACVSLHFHTQPHWHIGDRAGNLVTHMDAYAFMCVCALVSGCTATLQYRDGGSLAGEIQLRRHLAQAFLEVPRPTWIWRQCPRCIHRYAHMPCPHDYPVVKFTCHSPPATIHLRRFSGTLIHVSLAAGMHCGQCCPKCLQGPFLGVYPVASKGVQTERVRPHKPR